MLRKMVRIKAQTPGYDGVFVLDAVLVDNRIVEKVAFCGFYGELDGEFSPFVLRKNGTIDYGSDWEGEERERPCNIRTKVIELAAQFTIEEWDDDLNQFRDYVYAIKEVNDWSGR